MSKRKWLLIAITAITLAALFAGFDGEAAMNALLKADWTLLAAAAGLSLTFPLLSAWRWQAVSRSIGLTIAFKSSFSLIMAAWPLGAITPAKSGDLIKVVFLRNHLPYSMTAGLVLAERLIDVAVLSLFAAVGGLALDLPLVAAAGLAIAAATALFVALVALGRTNWLPGRIQPMAENVRLASSRLIRSPGLLLLSAAITALNWFASILQTWLCYASLQHAVPLDLIAAALPVAIFSGLLPITIAGMGTRDAAILFLFQNYAPYEINLMTGLLYSLFGYWLLTLLGLPFMNRALSGELRGIEADELKQFMKKT